MHRLNPAWLWMECLKETKWQSLLDLKRANDFLRTALLEYGKALYNKGSGISVLYKSRKNALKRERRNPEKRKSLLRTLTANRLMAEAVRFELTCP